MHVLDTTSTALVRLLVIAAVLAVPVLLVTAWRAGRTWRLVVAELTNSTGETDLDSTTIGLTQLARQRIDTEIRLVSQRRDRLRAALIGTANAARPASQTHGPPTPAAHPGPPPARIERRLDDSLAQLLSAARDIAPKEAQPAVQLLVMLISRPRGLLVVGMMQRRGGFTATRLGVTFDVLRLGGNKSLASQTFWEPEPVGTEAEERSPQERLLALFGPAARWVAIQLVIYTVFPGQPRGREKGLDRLFSGLLLQQSSDAYPQHATTFRRRAAEDLIEASDLLAQSPMPLAALADSLDKLAAAADSKADLYARAHTKYALAVATIERMRPPAPGLLQRYRVRQTISWLASGQPAPRKLALQRLADPDVGRPEPESAADLYDLACLYALATEAADSPEWRTQAARLLVRALAADLPARTLWDEAGRDLQLRILHGCLTAIKAAVSDELATGEGQAPLSLDVEGIVERAFSAAG
jgi:hypothetical protein